ncbi:unnamed protein product, partial [Cladocopium goreaui]
MAVSLLLQEAMAEMSKSAEAGWVGLVTRVKDQLGMAVAASMQEMLAEMTKNTEAPRGATTATRRATELLVKVAPTCALRLAAPRCASHKAKLQEEKSRAMEAESALREGRLSLPPCWAFKLQYLLRPPRRELKQLEGWSPAPVQAAAQAAAQAQAQAAQADEAVRQTREAEELRKQIAEHTEKLEAVQGSCHEAKQAAEKYKEETTKAIESVRDDALGAVASESKEAVAALETKFGEATRAQNEMKDKLEQ